MGTKPISIVIFGITGDLARNKLLPALYDLYRNGKLDKDFSIIGYGRKPLPAEDFSSLVFEAATKKDPSVSISILRERRNFNNRCKYIQGELEEKQGYDKLRESIGPGRRTIFFLSVHPELHQTIITQLGKEKLLQKDSQIMIEKPFGHDVRTAKMLDGQLRKYVSEDQIYRIDHYLGKDALVELLERRKTDKDFEKAIENDLKEVDVSLFETKRITGRGAFYDAVGALKDVGENHLLQMLAAVISSKNILSDDAHKVRKVRAAAVSSLHLKSPAARAQYVLYHFEPGVMEGSKTETFFSISAVSDLPKHSKVKISLSAGKALSESRADIKLIFKRPVALKEGAVSEVIFSLNKNDVNKKTHMEAYERIFLAAIDKDLSFFCSLDEVIAGWKFDAGVRTFWKKKKIPLERYKIGGKIHILKKD